MPERKYTFAESKRRNAASKRRWHEQHKSELAARKGKLDAQKKRDKSREVPLKTLDELMAEALDAFGHDARRYASQVRGGVIIERRNASGEIRTEYAIEEREEE